MTAQGWCRPEKAQGLLEWPGREQLFTEQGLASCYKGINHLKLVITGDDVEAKAYCGLLYKLLKPFHLTGRSHAAPESQRLLRITVPDSKTTGSPRRGEQNCQGRGKGLYFHFNLHIKHKDKDAA